MQQLFDIAAPALLAQNARSERSNDITDIDGEITEVICAYRGKDGLKCAIGHIIPDSIYQEKMEGRAVLELYTTYADFRTLISDEWDNELLTFLDKLQSVHDNYEPQKWRSALSDLACDFNLNLMSIYK
jgi:hypothetical protein